MWGGWGIYSPNHQKWSLGGCLSHDAPDSPVPLPRHGAVGFWPLELKSSGPPDSPVVHRTGPIDCLVRLLARAWLLRALARIKCCCRWPLTWKKSLLCWHTGHCPVLHRTVRWIIAVWPPEFLKVSSSELESLAHRTLSGGTPDSPVRQTRAHFGWLLLSIFESFLSLFIGLLWTLGTC
jgi:hypothetical protein